jgi:arylsulfatase A-like enzyme
MPALRLVVGFIIGIAAVACRSAAPPAPVSARSLVLITIDTLRADRVGAYGDPSARTPAIDDLARSGTLFRQAFAVAPITLTSHASMMTGRYPPGHGARHNGMRIAADVPTLAETLGRAGFATAAFVAAFPLDRRFGLQRGFATYGDRMPPGEPGRPANERPGRSVADEAIGWLGQHRSSRFFLWVHFFEPHAPYGNARDGRPVAVRYAEEVSEADTQMRRVLEAIGETRTSTLVAVTGDHGEAFGEHGEVAHSVFLYDTTLRVPLVLAGPGVPQRQIDAPVSHVDLTATFLHLLGVPLMDTDGVDLVPVLNGQAASPRELYAETFAPLLDFGWSQLRAVRADGWKYIEAPRSELYDVSNDAGEQHDRAGDNPARVAALRARLERYGSPELTAGSFTSIKEDAEARARLQALGYVSGDRTASNARADPKDRRELAARLAQINSGELAAKDLEAALRDVLRVDAQNPQAHMRLGYVLEESGRCDEAIRHFQIAIDARLPTADAHLGLAGCQASQRRFDVAIATLRAADKVEPDNPVVAANLGSMLSDSGRPADGIPQLQHALTIDPTFNQARFYLAIAFARAGRRDDATREVNELLKRLPSDAPQRSEVERLARTLQGGR